MRNQKVESLVVIVILLFTSVFSITPSVFASTPARALVNFTGQTTGQPISGIQNFTANATGATITADDDPVDLSNRVLKFDGAGWSDVILNNPSLTGDFGVDFRFYGNALNSSQLQVQLLPDPNNTSTVKKLLNTNGTNLNTYAFDSGSTLVTAITNSTWQNFRIIVRKNQATPQADFYCNGLYKGSWNFPSVYDFSGNANMGLRFYINPGAGNKILLDDVRLYPYDAQPKNSYSFDFQDEDLGYAPVSPGFFMRPSVNQMLVAQDPNDPNNNVMKFTNPTGTGGQVNDYIVINKPTTDFAIEFKTKVSDYGAGAWFVFARGGLYASESGTTEVQLGRSNSGNLHLSVTGGTFNAAIAASTLLNNQWQKVKITVNLTTKELRYFIDGKYVGNSTGYSSGTALTNLQGNLNAAQLTIMLRSTINSTNSILYDSVKIYPISSDAPATVDYDFQDQQIGYAYDMNTPTSTAVEIQSPAAAPLEPYLASISYDGTSTNKVLQFKNKTGSVNTSSAAFLINNTLQDFQVETNVKGSQLSTNGFQLKLLPDANYVEANAKYLCKILDNKVYPVDSSTEISGLTIRDNQWVNIKAVVNYNSQATPQTVELFINGTKYGPYTPSAGYYSNITGSVIGAKFYATFNSSSPGSTWLDYIKIRAEQSQNLNAINDCSFSDSKYLTGQYPLQSGDGTGSITEINVSDPNQGQITVENDPFMAGNKVLKCNDITGLSSPLYFDLNEKNVDMTSGDIVVEYKFLTQEKSLPSNIAELIYAGGSIRLLTNQNGTVYGDTGTDAFAGASYSENEWNKITMVINDPGSATPSVKYYLNNKYLGEKTIAAIPNDQRSNVTIRLSWIGNGINVMYFDDVKVYKVDDMNTVAATELTLDNVDFYTGKLADANKITNMATGNVIAYYTVTNTSQALRKSTIVLAAYRNNQLVGLSVNDAFIGIGQNHLTQNLSIASGSVDYIKAFELENLETIKPIGEFYKLQ